MDGAEALEGEKEVTPKQQRKLADYIATHSEAQQSLLPSRENLLTTQAEAELQEVNEIIKHIDEHVLFTGVKDLEVVRAKSRETISVLIQLLVSKGLITIQDVKRVLK